MCTGTSVSLSVPRNPTFEAHSTKGIPFANKDNVSLAIVENAQRIIGGNMLGFQAGNEPDLYVNHGRRPAVRSCASRLTLEPTILMTFVRATHNMTTSERSVPWCSKSPTTLRSQPRTIFSLFQAFKLYGLQKACGIPDSYH